MDGLSIPFRRKSKELRNPTTSCSPKQRSFARRLQRPLLTAGLALTICGCLDQRGQNAVTSDVSKLGGELTATLLGPQFRRLGQTAFRSVATTVFASLSADEKRRAEDARRLALDSAPAAPVTRVQPIAPAVANPPPRPTQPRTAQPRPTQPGGQPAQPSAPNFGWESVESPDTRGETTIIADGVGPNGQRCRRARTLVIRAGEELAEEAWFCKQPNGAWVAQV
jgi:hypothetical protein